VLNISGGTVSSNRCAIFNYDNAKITISGTALVTSTNSQPAGYTNCGTIYMSHVGGTNNRLSITGGTVENTANHVDGIAIQNDSQGSIEITGGKVLAKKGYAISRGGTGTLKVSDGIVFAYGTGDTDVINGDYTQSGNAVIGAWNESAGRTEYTINTSDDIYKLPTTATVKWAKQDSDNGISVKYNTNTGFIPIEGISLINDGTGVKQLTIDNGQLTIYPNPTMGQLTIENGEWRVKNIEVFDINGRKLYPHSTFNSQLSTQIDVSHLSAGIYFVKISTENGDVVKKVVKE
jgi:hypothetical protein